MAASAVRQLIVPLFDLEARPPSILVGVTHPQTCLVLKGRLRALQEAGFEVTLVSSPGRLLHQTAARERVQPVAIPMRRKIAPLADVVSLIRLWRLLGELKPDIVEFSTPKAGLLGSLAAWLRGVPRRVYMLRGLKLETSTGWKRCILLVAERLAAACSHVVLCNSESLRAQALALGIAPAEKLLLLGEGSGGGVDVERFAPGPARMREHLGFSREDLVVGFVGRLTRDKGVPELLDAFEKILRAEPAARLLLVGWFDKAEDALADAIRVQIENHPRIHLTGFVADTAPYYRTMDVLVLPTWREGFPNVVLEAAATGVPAVTTDATGSRDSVVPQRTGLLVPPGVPEAIARAVLTLLGDPKRRKCMGEAARAWVLAHYVDEQVLGSVAGFYLGMLDDAQEAVRVPS